MIRESRLIKFTLLACFIFTIVLHWYITRMTPNPHYGKVFYKLGMECRGKCSLDKQLSYFRKAVFYDPNLNDAYFQMGIIYGKKGDNEKEFASYRKVAMLDHANADAHFKMGTYCFQRGEPDYALRYFLQSDRYKPGSLDTIYYMARLYDKKQIYKDAVRHYVRLLSRGSPFSAEVCKRIRLISEMPDQYEMVLYEVYQIHNNKGQERLWEQIDRYLRTGRLPEFMHQSNN